jgi:hypothetical protein
MILPMLYEHKNLNSAPSNALARWHIAQARYPSAYRDGALPLIPKTRICHRASRIAPALLAFHSERPASEDQRAGRAHSPMNTEVQISAPQSQQPTRQQLAAVDRTKPGKVTGRLKVALHAMVWLGMKRAQAAEHAGLKEQSLYVALCRPHVRTYYLAQLEVLRTSERARNIHTLAEVRDQTSNQMARVQAVKALEQLEDQPASRGGAQQAPGFVIVVQQALTPQQRNIQPKPLIEHTSGSDQPAALPYQGDADG